MSEHFGIIRFI